MQVHRKCPDEDARGKIQFILYKRLCRLFAIEKKIDKKVEFSYIFAAFVYNYSISIGIDFQKMAPNTDSESKTNEECI